MPINPNSTDPNSANYGDVNRGVTDVGAYSVAQSPYGTFDQGGNLSEWTDSIVGSSDRRARGGQWSSFSSGLAAGTSGAGITATNNLSALGFRVTQVPEPSQIGVAMGLVALLFSFRARRRKVR